VFIGDTLACDRCGCTLVEGDCMEPELARGFARSYGWSVAFDTHRNLILDFCSQKCEDEVAEENVSVTRRLPRMK